MRPCWTRTWMPGWSRFNRISAPGRTPAAATGKAPSADGATLGSGNAVEFLVRPAEFGQDAAGQAYHRDARRGGPHPTRMPLEQLQADDGLKFLEAARDCRLPDPKGRGGLQQAAMCVQRIDHPVEEEA